ncbi:MAG: hypothetical protein K2N34_16040 [Lachnospiraceae bacterium]|nr:hypothetical protein [Lachnospiraceae bacterium]
MKRIIASICLVLSIVFTMAACAEYTPQQEDFELTVTLNKTDFIQGETIEYTVKLTRKNGPPFRYRGSSTLCSRYFEPVGAYEEPSFARSDDLAMHRISRRYKYEESSTIYTSYYEPGEYLFAICFFMRGLEYYFEQAITIKAE